MAQNAYTITPSAYKGNIETQAGPTPIPEAAWYQGNNPGDGLLYTFPAGTLAEMNYLTADLLLDGAALATFVIVLQEGENGPTFELSSGFLNQCQARMRVPLEAVNQNRWRYEREGAWLKPRCQGQRVNLHKVDRMRFEIERKSPWAVRWCMTDFIATVGEPPPLSRPILPKGPLLDELGQYTLQDWQTRSRSAAEVTARLQAQYAAASGHQLPEHTSRWGGWLGRRFEASGFFSTINDGQRWWLVDPDGYAFWSAGLDCVSVDTAANYQGLENALGWLPEAEGDYQAIFSRRRGEAPHINYLAANFIRAFGAQEWHEKWASITLGELRRMGFNTVANWSDWRIARQAGVPYVRPLSQLDEYIPRGSTLKMVYRDFPDVFHPDFHQLCADFAEQLRETADDPAFIGYFLMNEPTWGFAQETPAAGMLYNTADCFARQALSRHLFDKYNSPQALATAWGMPVTLATIAEGRWEQALTPAAQADLAEFSGVMVERLLGGLSQACKAVDFNHLNLGARYYTVPPAWALEGMRHFDVFSMNCYRKSVPADEVERISSLLNQPVMIGEWHFGALDAGLPASGIGHVPDQPARGQAYRYYLENAAALPACIGTHYFILYDQSALGRFDGENYNIGFLDVCNRPYEPLADAARLSHERMYEVAARKLAPYNEPPEYLPMLFM